MGREIIADASHETRFRIYDREGVGGFNDGQVPGVGRFGVKID